jgi:NitT/TauT family transport system substrate-binding protein
MDNRSSAAVDRLPLLRDPPPSLALGMGFSPLRLLGFGVGAALLSTATACRWATPQLEVPVSNWPGYEYVYLAHKLGLDRRNGISIQPLQFPDPQTIVHAYLRGEVPMAQLTTVEAAR